MRLPRAQGRNRAGTWAGLAAGYHSGLDRCTPALAAACACAGRGVRRASVRAMVLLSGRSSPGLSGGRVIEDVVRSLKMHTAQKERALWCLLLPRVNWGGGSPLLAHRGQDAWAWCQPLPLCLPRLGVRGLDLVGLILDCHCGGTVEPVPSNAIIFTSSEKTIQPVHPKAKRRTGRGWCAALGCRYRPLSSGREGCGIRSLSGGVFGWLVGWLVGPPTSASNRGKYSDSGALAGGDGPLSRNARLPRGFC